MADAYMPPPAKTMDDIDKVITFLKARLVPLRDSAEPGSDEESACQAVLDMATVMRGSAQAEINHGDDPTLLHFYLTIAAQQWREHPDFLPEWKNV